jgi:MFS family permease
MKKSYPHRIGYPPPPSSLSQVEKKTLVVDLLNRIPDGIINQLIMSVFVLLAIKVYHSNDLQKAILTTARNAGMMGGLLLMPVLARLGLKKSTLTGLLIFLSGGCLVLSGFVRTAWSYTVILALCAVFFQCRLPYMTSIYGHNYSEKHRSGLYGWGIMTASVATLFSSLLLGGLLEGNTANYRVIFIAIGLFTMAVSIPLMRLDTGKLTPQKATSPLSHFSNLFTDPYFGYFNLIWIIFGLAESSIAAMLVIHLAEPERGLGLSSLQVMLIAGVLASVVQIGANRPLIKIFSKMSIYQFRLLCSLIIAAGTLMFFFSSKLYMLAVAQTVLCIGMTGDSLLWGIYVTRIAPASKTHIYMSIHTFFAGVRGFIGPGLTFLLIQRFSLQQFALIAAAMVLFSALMVLPVSRGWWKIHPLSDSSDGRLLSGIL